MTVLHLSQLRELQDENARLKRMYADLALMNSALKDVVGFRTQTSLLAQQLGWRALGVDAPWGVLRVLAPGMMLVGSKVKY
jgi:hypothetical protein